MFLRGQWSLLPRGPEKLPCLGHGQTSVQTIGALDIHESPWHLGNLDPAFLEQLHAFESSPPMV